MSNIIKKAAKIAEETVGKEAEKQVELERQESINNQVVQGVLSHFKQYGIEDLEVVAVKKTADEVVDDVEGYRAGDEVEILHEDSKGEIGIIVRVEPGYGIITVLHGAGDYEREEEFGPEDLKKIGSMKTTAEQTRHPVTDAPIEVKQFGIFTYDKGTDEILDTVYYDDKDKAIAWCNTAWEEKDTDEQDSIYMEVWEKDEEGDFGNIGKSIHKIDTDTVERTEEFISRTQPYTGEASKKTAQEFRPGVRVKDTESGDVGRLKRFKGFDRPWSIIFDDGSFVEVSDETLERRFTVVSKDTPLAIPKDDYNAASKKTAQYDEDILEKIKERYNGLRNLETDPECTGWYISPEGKAMFEFETGAQIDVEDMDGKIMALGSKKTAQPQYPGIPGGPLGIGGTDKCVCPECGYEEKHERGVPCSKYICPACANDRGDEIHLVGKDMPHGEGKGATKKTASYGDEYIKHDMKKGIPDDQIVERIIERYPDISEEQANQIVKNIHEFDMGKWDEVLGSKKTAELQIGDRVKIKSEYAKDLDLSSDVEYKVVDTNEIAEGKQVAHIIDTRETNENRWVAVRIDALEKIGSMKTAGYIENFIVNVKPLMMKLRNKEEMGPGELNTVLEFYLEAAAEVPGIRNFALNIKPTMIKIKDKEELSDTEKESIVQFYLETSAQVTSSQGTASKKTALKIKLTSPKFNGTITATIRKVEDDIVKQIEFDDTELKKAYDIADYMVVIKDKGRYVVESIDDKTALTLVLDEVYSEATPEDKARMVAAEEVGDIKVERIEQQIQQTEKTKSDEPVTVVYETPDEPEEQKKYVEKEPEYVSSALEDEDTIDEVKQIMEEKRSTSLENQARIAIQSELNELEIPVDIVDVKIDKEKLNESEYPHSVQYESDNIEGDIPFEMKVEDDIVTEVKSSMDILKGKFGVKEIEVEIGERIFKTEARDEITAVKKILEHMEKEGNYLQYNGRKISTKYIEDDVIQKIAEEQTKVVKLYQAPVDLENWQITKNEDGKHYFERK